MPAHLSLAAHERRLALYHDGATDARIAAELGVHPNAIGAWRKNHKLPRNVAPGAPLSSEANAARLLLYQMRYSDKRIAREQGCNDTTIFCWRKSRNLPAHGLSRRHWQRSDLSRDTTLEAIKRAIGRALPRDIADDAVGDLYLAVLSGEVSLDRIGAEARRYGNRVLAAFASKFGPRSLDEELGDDAGFRMIDLVRDDRSSAWLEEMGATVA